MWVDEGDELKSEGRCRVGLRYVRRRSAAGAEGRKEVKSEGVRSRRAWGAEE